LIVGSWQASLRYTVNLPANSHLLMGLESDGDSIRSYNFSGGVRTFALGLHARNRGAGYIDLDLTRAKSRRTLSAGMREEIFSGGPIAVFSPQLAGSFRLTNALKLRASGGYGFRIPTYTDLYCSDPTTLGNPNLKPESAWSFDAGIDWRPSRKLALTATGFYSRQHDTIDYVRPDASALWQAAKLSGLHFTGVESTLTWIPARSQTARIAWTELHGAQSALNGIQSEYIFNYPVENIVAS
jgi:iron complex outermembrane receptor protein